MSSEVLIVLFLVLGLISTLIKKFQERQRQRIEDMEHPSRRVGPQRRDVIDPEEEEIDLSEWDIFMDGPKAPEPGEFREVRGTRSVSEADTGPEFQEVRGKRSVSEEDTGPEYREVEIEQPAQEEGEPRTIVRFVEVGASPSKRSKRRIRLTPKTVRQAILYYEIIGPPRADRPF